MGKDGSNKGKDGSPAGRLLIFLFAAAIVALGANELQNTFSGQFSRSGKGDPQVVRDLLGSSPIERAQMAPRQGTSQAQRSNDSLTSADRNQLQSLIDSVGN